MWQYIFVLTFDFSPFSAQTKKGKWRPITALWQIWQTCWFSTEVLLCVVRGIFGCWLRQVSSGHCMPFWISASQCWPVWGTLGSPTQTPRVVFWLSEAAKTKLSIQSPSQLPSNKVGNDKIKGGSLTVWNRTNCAKHLHWWSNKRIYCYFLKSIRYTTGINNLDCACWVCGKGWLRPYESSSLERGMLKHACAITNVNTHALICIASCPSQSAHAELLKDTKN